MSRRWQLPSAMRALVCITGPVVLAGTLLLSTPAGAAGPAGGVSLAGIGQSASWTGGPLTGSYGAYEGQCQAPTCDEVAVKVTVPSSSWDATPGGLAVAIDWSGTDPGLNRNQELDLYLVNPSGAVAASSNFGGTTSQRVLLSHPTPGTYTVVVEAFDAVDMTYQGSVGLVSERAPLAASAGAGRGMQFSPEALVDPQFTTGEPGMWDVPGGPIYVDAPWHLDSGTSFVWRSDDGARTFRQLAATPAPGVTDPRRRPCSESGGGGDTDLVADRSGQNVMLADLEAASIATAFSTDGGTSWRCSAVGASSPDDDRPWLAPALGGDGAGPHVDAYLVYRTTATTGQFAGVTAADPTRIQVDATRDGGQTWTARGSLAAALVGQVGPAFSVADGTPEGSLYVVFSGVDDAVYVARSTDEGRSFLAPVAVSRRPGWPANAFVTGAADADGNLYVAWVDAGAGNVMLSVSRDRATHWSAPRQVNPPGSTAVMPWVAAGRGGDVAVAWYGTPGRVDALSAPAGQRWYAYAARSESDAGRSDARFTVARMSEAAVHVGPVCFVGVQCTAGRNLGDFFKIAIDRSGAIIGVFDDAGRIGTPADGGQPAAYVVAVRQTGGLGVIDGGVVGVNATRGTGIPRSLEFTAAPTASLDSGGLHLRFTLAGSNLGAAPATGGLGLTTDAGWLLVWRTADRVEYAELNVDSTGTRTVFGGGEPVPVGDTTTFSYVSYPPQVPLTGTVDPIGGSSAASVTITIPPATLSGTYQLRHGDVLRGLQAFSFTGTALGIVGQASNASVSGTAAPFLVVDSTGPKSIDPSALISSGAAAAPPPAAASRVLPDTRSQGGSSVVAVAGLAAAAIACTLQRRRRRRETG